MEKSRKWQISEAQTGPHKRANAEANEVESGVNPGRATTYARMPSKISVRPQKKEPRTVGEKQVVERPMEMRGVTDHAMQ